MLPLLPDRARLIGFDRDGFGRSPRSTAPLSIDQLADDLVALAEAVVPGLTPGSPAAPGAVSPGPSARGRRCGAVNAWPTSGDRSKLVWSACAGPPRADLREKDRHGCHHPRLSHP